MKHPPKLPLLILRLFAGKQIIDELEGDLYEDFLDNLELYGPKKARRLYYWTALSSIRPYLIIHNRENRKPKLTDMINYHLKMALRNMSKNKTFTAINILGLAVGLASSLAILLFIADQSMTDAFLENRSRIYRLESEIERNDTKTRSASQHSQLLPAVEDGLPGIAAYARMSNSTRTLMRQDEEGMALFEEDFLFTDPDFFKVFPFKVLRGERTTLLQDPGSVLITVSTAQRYFGKTDVVGEIVEFAEEYDEPKKVAAVLADPPRNSTIKFSFIAPVTELLPPNGKDAFKSMFSLSLPVYLLLEERADPQAIAEGVAPLLRKHTNKSNLIDATYSLQGFEDLKYDAKLGDNIVTPVDRRVINMFLVIAVFIIVLAMINYINLTSARAIERAHEVGVRKVSGASRKTLLRQFLIESLVLCLLSLVLALLSLEAVVPFFENILGQRLNYGYHNDLAFWVSVVGGVLLLGLLAGVYPALVLSRFNLARFLNGRFGNSRQGDWLRKLLVVGQFTFSIALIIGAMLVQQQLNFVRKQTLSYSPSHIIIIKGKFGMLSKNHQAVKSALEQIPGVSKVSIASTTPGGGRYMTMGSKDLPTQVVRYYVDDDYFDIFNLEMEKGEGFGSGAQSSGEVIINQTLAELLEVEDPLYSTAYKFHGRENNKITGVVKDFHFESLHTEIRPVVMVPAAAMAPALTQVVVRVQTDEFREVTAKLEKKWKEFFPEAVFDFEFLDDRLNRLYTAEYRLSEVFGVFTLLAVFISCLGLFGLSTHLAQVKLKEISIRKVLGASMGQMVVFMSKRVYVLVILAALLAVPIAYYFIEQWLNDFAYRMTISWTVFALTFALCLLLATLTTGWHALKVADTNPADTLRNE